MDPASLRYLESHEWASLEGEIATIGITQFAVEQLTDLVHVELPESGASVSVKESFGEVESVKAVSDLYSPVSGKIVEVNEKVREDASLITEDPFGDGWLVKVRVSDTNLDHLLTHEGYEKQISE